MKNKQHKQFQTNFLKQSWLKATLLTATLLAPLAIAAPAAFAATDASFSLTPASGSYTTGDTVTVKVYANAPSGDNANAVQANLTFTGLTNPNVTVNTAIFSLCVAPYAGNSYVSGSNIQIPCASTSSFSGNQLVATLTFSASSAGSSAVTMASGSDIQASGTSVYNGSLPTTQFSTADPTPPPAGGGGTGTGGGGNGGGGNSGGGTGTGGRQSGGGTNTGGGGSNSGGGTTTTPPPTDGGTTPITTTTGTAALNVTVTDSAGKPIENAKVVIDGHYNENTDAKGTAGFTGLPVGDHTIAVSAPGKATTQTKITLAANDSRQVSLKLASKGLSLLMIVAGIVAIVIVGGGAAALYIRRSRRNPSMPGVSMSGMVVGSASSPAVRVESVVSPTNSPSMPTALTQPQVAPPAPALPLAPPQPQPAVPPAQQLPPAIVPTPAPQYPPVTPPSSGPQPPQPS